MARRVFFSFHYEADAWRAGQVRNSWVTKGTGQDAGFWDAAAWEEVQRRGDAAIRRWIDDQLNGTSVTVVLIGAQTATRPYVLYEIAESHARGNGMLGIYIDRCGDRNGRTCARGANPFGQVSDGSASRTPLSRYYPTYDWVADGGYNNLAGWVERAAKDAGR